MGLVRLILAYTIVAWFGAVQTVIRNHASFSPRSSPSSSKPGAGSVRGSRVAEVSLSLLGTTAPGDFRPSNPGAPPCSDPLDATDVSYTLVSQLSHDRIWMVPHHCERWGSDDPMLLAVFTDLTTKEVISQLVAEGCSYGQLTVQTVSPKVHDPTGTEYPVNSLRNLALSRVKTSHVVYADVDFWPSADLHDVLSLPVVRKGLAKDSKLAAVIPAFQLNRLCDEDDDNWDCRRRNIHSMPRDREGLLFLETKRKVSRFDPWNLEGHGTTRYQTWRDQARGTFVDLPCVKSNRYEPYLTVRWCNALPPFQEGFTGYGKNKMTVSVVLFPVPAVLFSEGRERVAGRARSRGLPTRSVTRPHACLQWENL
ncbi:hypothetical protein ACHAWF_001175 [Thalassiosira exigua]